MKRPQPLNIRCILLQHIQSHRVQRTFMRALQLDPRYLNAMLLLMLQRLVPPCRLNTPPLSRSDAHLLQVDSAIFRCEVEEGLCEFGRDGRLRVAEPGLEGGGRDGFAGHGVHAAGGVLEEGLVEDCGDRRS